MSNILFDVHERDVGFINRKTNELVPISGHKALVRADDMLNPVTLAIVKDTYKVVQNKELFTEVNRLIGGSMRSDYTRDMQITDRSSYNGAICYREYVFPSMQISGSHGKPIAFRIIVKNSFGRTALTMHYGAIDFYCTNGMIIGDFTSQYAKHTSGLQINSFLENLSTAAQGFDMFGRRLNMWMHNHVPVDDAHGLLSTFNDGLKDKLIKYHDKYRLLPSHGDTTYSLYSALTHYASHHPVKRSKNDHEDATRLGREEFVRRIVEKHPEFFPKLEKETV